MNCWLARSGGLGSTGPDEWDDWADRVPQIAEAHRFASGHVGDGHWEAAPCDCTGIANFEARSVLAHRTAAEAHLYVFDILELQRAATCGESVGRGQRGPETGAARWW